MTDTNNQIIMNMYQGEKRRDASSKVCGYLFQDLIAVDKLLSEDTDYICLEYLEDVFVSLKGNGTSKDTVYIIQAKYYTKGSVTLSEVIRDLYYQYLRLNLYGYSGNVIPVLATHYKNKLRKPTLTEMQGKDYINVNRNVKPTPHADINEWLCSNVYILNKKDAENTLFREFACNDSINNFLDVLKIENDYKSLNKYRNDISLKLNKINFTGCPITNDEMRQNVLLGLAVQFVQKKLSVSSSATNIFDSRKCKHDEFIQYLTNQICTETDASIGAYLRTVVMNCWDNIEECNKQLTQKQVDILQCIRDNIADWLYDLGSTPQGQLQLLNTVSLKKSKSLTGFCEMSVKDRFKRICEHRDYIDVFLQYLWKIMFDINQNLLGKSLSDDEKLRLNPIHYVDDKETRYINVKFPDDICRSAVILSEPRNSHSDEDLSCIFERMHSFRPEKWYMCGQYRGKYSYEQNVAEIINNNSLSEIKQNQFRIECMKCVKVSMNFWQNAEDCKNTIFRESCIND